MKCSAAVISVSLAVVFVCVFAPTSHAVLIGLWQFDEGSGTTVADSSGNGLEGELLQKDFASNLPDWINGHTGAGTDKALRFGAGGSLNMMSAPYQPIMDSPAATGAVTMSAWISSEQVAESTNTTYGRVFQRLHYLMYMDALPAIDSLGASVNLAFPADPPYRDVYDRTETPVPVSLNSATTPAWTHVCVTYDGSTVKLYVNAELKYAEAHQGTFIGDWVEDVQVGNSNRPGVGHIYNRQFVGAIDDVAYFDTALTPTEISLAMGGDYSGFVTRPVEGSHAYGAAVAALQPTHHYRFGTTGAVAPDSGFGTTPVDGVLHVYHGGANLGAEGPGASSGLNGFAASPVNGALGANDRGSVYLGQGTDWAAELMTFSGWVGLAPGTGTVLWDRVFANGQLVNNFQIVVREADDLEGAAGLYVTTDDPSFGSIVAGFLDDGVVNLVDQQWHHLFVVRNGDGIGNLKVVIDGVDRTTSLVESTVTDWGQGDPNGDAYLGGADSFSALLTGRIDEASVWVGSALTVADAITLYQAGVGSPPTLVPGDTNHDGKVNEVDAAALAQNWGATSGASWEMGDFNDDDAVNAADASILAANWGDHTGESTAAVPEPSVLALMALTAGLLACARRRS